MLHWKCLVWFRHIISCPIPTQLKKNAQNAPGPIFWMYFLESFFCFDGLVTILILLSFTWLS
jgi:hypothetical protein